MKKKKVSQIIADHQHFLKRDVIYLIPELLDH